MKKRLHVFVLFVAVAMAAMTAVAQDVHTLAKPTAKFAVEGLFEDINTSNPVAFADSPVKFVNLTTGGATSYEWKITDETSGDVIFTSSLTEPTYTFETSGSFKVELTATNSSGSRTTSKTLILTVHSGVVEGLGISSSVKGAGGDNPLYTSQISSVPTLDSDTKYDFITGPNHLYSQIAERCNFPTEHTYSISSITVGLFAYSRMSATSAEDRNHPFNIAFYGETDGRLDPNICYGRLESWVADLMGETGYSYGNNCKLWGFDVSSIRATVSGPTYIALEISEDMPIESPDPNLTRSYICFAPTTKGNGVSSLWVKPRAEAELEIEQDGGWYVINDVVTDLGKAYGLYMVIWCNMNTDVVGQVALDLGGDVLNAVRVDGSTLHISGTIAGEPIAIYSLAGVKVLGTTGADTATAVDINDLAPGVYTVATSAGAFKFKK
ncbi:MAG: PKD domain-containing protein [Muribaculaceae bacterium]